MSWTKLFRRKLIDNNEVSTELHRVLTTIDLTLLGIGSTLGTGIYVLAGQVAKTDAGPAVVISFLVAAFASVLAGLCYAEFGARVPKAGSAYVYSYVCVGEIIAFIVGWNLVMEYVIGVASVSKAYSGYVDSLVPNHGMSEAFKDVGIINVSFLSEYFDFFAFGITIVLTLLLTFGVKESSLFNNVFTVLNLLVVLFVIIAGGIYSNVGNWKVDEGAFPECKNITGHEVEPGEVKAGGFMPFGLKGVMAGAATCFYGFIGFDVIATTGEEAKNPKRSIPLSIVLSLLFIFVAYFGISTVLTMMVPYYCQDDTAPLPFAFEYQGFNFGKWVVNIGALFALATSLLGSMFPMPRIIYSMAKDGLLFNFLSYVHPRYQTPVVATLIGGLLGAIMGALFKLDSLIDMMSIGTLTAYTLVALCVLMLRYRKDENGVDGYEENPPSITVGRFLGQTFNLSGSKVPTRLSTVYTTVIVVLYCVICFAFCGVLIIAQHDDSISSLEEIVPLGVLGGVLILLMVAFMFQPVSRQKLNFKVPLVPWIPGLSILINTYLILELSAATWIRFGIWMAVGLVIYMYCLCSGRATRTYNATAEEVRGNMKSENAKHSMHGIDNPALEFQDEKSSYPEYKSEKSPQEFKQTDGLLNGSKGSYGTVQTNGLLLQNIKQQQQQSEAPSAPKDPILRIHESSQNTINGIPVDPSSLVLLTEEEKKQNRDSMQKVMAEVVEEEEEEESPAVVVVVAPPPPGPKKYPPTIVNIHHDAQAMFTGSTPEDVVDGVIGEAEQIVNDKAEKLVETILALAAAELDPALAPPSVNRKKVASEFQTRVHFPLDSDLKSPAPEDPIQHVHENAQAVLQGKSAPYRPLLSPAEQLVSAQSSLKALIEALEAPALPPVVELVVPEGFGERLMATHLAAKNLLAPTNTIEKIHEMNQQVISGGTPQGAPHTASPEMRKEIKELAAEFMSNPANFVEKPEPASPPQADEPSFDPSIIPPALLKIHEEAQALLAPEDPLAVIHRICQLCLNNSRIKDKPVTSSRSQREQTKSFMKQLFKRTMDAAPETSAVSQGPPPPPPAELVATILAIHDKAQEVLRVPPPPPSIDPAEAAAKIETIHQIAQLCMNGVNVESVPWLEPVLASEEEKKSIRELHKELLEQLPSLSNPSDPDPAPPHVLRRLLDDIHGIHLMAQESLRKPNVRFDTNDDYASIDYVLPESPPEERSSSQQQFLSLGPAQNSDEPVYATVNKKVRASEGVDVPRVTVSFNEEAPAETLTPPDDEVPSEALERLKRRRPTGPNIHFNPRKPVDRDSIIEDDDEPEGEEEEETYHSAYENIDSNDEREDSSLPLIILDKENVPAGQEEPQAAVPRRQSQQNRPVDNLISMFDNAAE